MSDSKLALDFDYKERVDDFMDETAKETARLSVHIENLGRRLDEHKEDVEEKFDKIDNKLDKLMESVDSNNRSTERIQQNHELRIQNIEKEQADQDRKAEKISDSKTSLYIAVASPIVAGIIEFMAHFVWRK